MVGVRSALQSNQQTVWSGEGAAALTDADAAIRVFALNVLLFPASRNALDSLAEAYEARGDLARSSAIRQGIKDMPARPGNNDSTEGVRLQLFVAGCSPTARFGGASPLSGFGSACSVSWRGVSSCRGASSCSRLPW